MAGRLCTECFEPVESEDETLCRNCAEGIYPLDQYEEELRRDEDENRPLDYWDFTADL